MSPLDSETPAGAGKFHRREALRRLGTGTAAAALIAATHAHAAAVPLPAKPQYDAIIEELEHCAVVNQD